MALRKFRSVTLINKYGFTLPDGNSPYIICFSGAEKFLDIFSPALMFSLVLSFVSRQKKEHRSRIWLESPSNIYQSVDNYCSFSFVRPKENEPKEKGALRKWFRRLASSETSRLQTKEAIFKVVPNIVGTPKIAFEVPVKSFMEGDVTPFSKGAPTPSKSIGSFRYAR